MNVRRHGVVRIPGAEPAARCQRWATAVRDARPHWCDDWDGTQFSLGRAWYTHLEQGRTGAYFSGARESDALVERHVPGFAEAMREHVRNLVGGEPVVQREGYCGPGLHVFPAGGLAARRGGDVHFDTEGLTRAQLREGAPALTFVLAIAVPESGGGLAVWDERYDHERDGDGDPDGDRDPELGPPLVVPYEAGDLVVLDSYHLHQIQPFGGSRPRVTGTLHAVRWAGRWETWF